MPTNNERIARYFDEHTGTTYSYKKIAEELGLEPKTVSSAVSIYFFHRIGIDESDKGKILPNDGFSDPTGATQSRQPNRLPFVKSARLLTRNSKKQALDEIEEDRGSY